MCKVSSSVHFSNRSNRDRGDGTTNAHWVPNTDVYTTDNGLVVKAELAGMRSDSLEIIVEGSRLRISGIRADGCRASKCSFQVMEINYGPFESVLDLPKGYDLSQAKASYLNGFLRIDVPVAVAHTKSTKVPVAEGD
jgi:HSP20 family protein